MASGHDNYRIEKLILYETASNFYIVGCDKANERFRLIKLDRTESKPATLQCILHEDPMLYSSKEIADMLKMINEGNKSSGGLIQVLVAFGLVGFTRFLDCYYVTLITSKKKVGCIGSNIIYAVKSTEIIAIRPKDEFGDEISFRRLWHHVNKKIHQTSIEIAESRYMGLFQFIDMTKDFYFSYTYDLTHSYQYNYVVNSSKCFPSPPTQVCIYTYNYISFFDSISLCDVNSFDLPRYRRFMNGINI